MYSKYFNLVKRIQVKNSTGNEKPGTRFKYAYIIIFDNNVKTNNNKIIYK